MNAVYQKLLQFMEYMDWVPPPKDREQWVREQKRAAPALAVGFVIAIALTVAGVWILLTIRWADSWGWVAFKLAASCTLIVSALLAMFIAAFVYDHYTTSPIKPRLPHLKNDKIRCPGCKKKVLLAPFCKKCGRSLRDCV